MDLSFSLSVQKPRRVYTSHAGDVTGITGSGLNSLLVSGGGADGRACIHDLNRRKMVSQVGYSSAGVECLTWVPTEVRIKRAYDLGRPVVV